MVWFSYHQAQGLSLKSISFNSHLSMPPGLLLTDASHSLFAAKAGASRVIAVDGSAKMSSVATQVCLF